MPRINSLRKFLEFGERCRLKKMYFIIKALHKSNDNRFNKHQFFLTFSYYGLLPIFGKNKFLPSIQILPTSLIIKHILFIEKGFYHKFFSCESNLYQNCIIMFEALIKSDIRFESLDELKKEFKLFQSKNKTQKQFSKAFFKHMELKLNNKPL